ncbi:ClpXP protease specificity-enhancing factor [Sulfuricystis thermophila]|jgi:stringent starvation protein B|uniref:ClpXP protease specificity-enhancing factor n=1 Tax=Sulfuricystis thermophila TaxID=2496847 RepID=UPI0024DF64EE|nr:ClpXP protease specificity-enhancing factor [Sulfuricystis thermophila]
MSSTKPYLIRAIYEWCVDNGHTPYLVVQVDAHTRVPREYVRDGQIVLNISPEATHQLMMGNDEISFQTRFGGAPFQVSVPVAAVAAIYARENGQGMAFEVTAEEASATEGKVGAGETAPEATEPAVERAVEHATKRSVHLTRVK